MKLSKTDTEDTGCFRCVCLTVMCCLGQDFHHRLPPTAWSVLDHFSWQKYLHSHCGRHTSADGILFVYVSPVSALGHWVVHWNQCQLRLWTVALFEFSILLPTWSLIKLSDMFSSMFCFCFSLMRLKCTLLKCIVFNGLHKLENSHCSALRAERAIRRHQLVESRREI